MRSSRSRPSLSTERLKLKWLSADDAAFMLSIWNDPAFVRFVGDRGIRSEDDARQALRSGVLKMYAEYGYGPYLLSLRGDGTPIGICGLFHRAWLDDPDIGFALLPDWCGRGLAREAADAVIEHARTDLGIGRLTAIVAEDNDSSVSLIRKLGFVYERMISTPGDDRDACLYCIEWTASAEAG